ncbi:hypothetical protein [Pseudonocardia sp. GCM10023141]|uniref:hypothetical protein n=1 Tax=Pseudonocardia sp. GCM10023141 TaxID=3252653 RepID=UPI0036239602
MRAVQKVARRIGAMLVALAAILALAVGIGSGTASAETVRMDVASGEAVTSSGEWVAESVENDVAMIGRLF